MALAAHAVGFAVVRPSNRTPKEPAPQAELVLDIEAATPSPFPDDQPAREAPVRTAPTDTSRPLAAVTRERTGPSLPEPEPSASPPVAQDADGTWTFSPSTTGPGQSSGPLAGRSLDSAVRAGVDTTLAQERADPTRHRLLPIIDPRDIERGLAPGSAIASIARDLVRRSRAPDVSHALLQFDSDGTGTIAAFRVLDASSGRSEWEEVAAKIAAEARTRPPLHVPPGAQGLSVTIDVTSEMRTASGARTDLGTFDKIVGAINDPIGTATRTPPQRNVVARLVDARYF
jgi:hypothetical protein